MSKAPYGPIDAGAGDREVERRLCETAVRLRRRHVLASAHKGLQKAGKARWPTRSWERAGRAHGRPWKPGAPARQYEHRPHRAIRRARLESSFDKIGTRRRVRESRLGIRGRRVDHDLGEHAPRHGITDRRQLRGGHHRGRHSATSPWGALGSKSAPRRSAEPNRSVASARATQYGAWGCGARAPSGTMYTSTC